MLAIGVSGLYYLFDKTYYLPFLGETILPVRGNKFNLNSSTNPSDKSITIKLTNLPQKSIVVYWGAKGDGGNVISTPREAYGEYINSGVTMSNDNGEATVVLDCPSQYSVKHRILDAHIHYRYQLSRNKGLFSEVYTKGVDRCT